jgi:N-carbamoylputrescine amidase
LLAQASTDKPEVLVTEVSRRRTEDVRRIWPFFRDRRIDAYGEITSRFGEPRKEP